MSERPAPASLLKHAAHVASFYGFRPLRELERKIPYHTARAHSFATASQAAVLGTGATHEPQLVYWASQSPTHLPMGLSPREHGEFGLHIVGVDTSIAEVVLVKAVASILSEWGAPVANVRLNALGDKDSKARFEREAGGYLRKHAAHLDKACREALGQNILGPYRCQGQLCRSVVESGPRPMSFLSEKSRFHFKEVLEHLEKLGLPYAFDDLLIGDERDPRILFAFDLAEEDGTIVAATGGRFDDHFRQLAQRPTAVHSKESSGVSASIFFKRAGLAASAFKLATTGPTPSVYFVQLGLRAKLEGLAVIDTLRAAHIPVLQSFDWGHLAPQLTAARAAGVSHLLIMGQREALDRTILVRAMDNSSQTIVGLHELPRYLKNLR